MSLPGGNADTAAFFNKPTHRHRVHVRVPISIPAHQSHGLTLPNHDFDLDVVLEIGNHTFVSQPISIGCVKTAGLVPLTLKFAFDYHWSPETREITVCDKDYPSSKGMKVLTEPENTGQVCVEYAANGVGFYAEEGYANSLWNPRSKLFSGAHALLKALARNACDSLVDSLHAVSSFRGVTTRALFPDLNDQDYFGLVGVHQEQGKFVEVFDPEKEYAFPHIIGIPESFLDGPSTTYLAANGDFANVRGSKDDPKIKKLDWRPLWESYFGKADKCASEGYPANVTCATRIIGGHCVLGQTPKSFTKADKSDEVFIIPICDTHNKTYKTWMEAIKYHQVIRLKDYLSG